MVNNFVIFSFVLFFSGIILHTCRNGIFEGIPEQSDWIAIWIPATPGSAWLTCKLRKINFSPPSSVCSFQVCHSTLVDYAGCRKIFSDNTYFSLFCRNLVAHFIVVIAIFVNRFLKRCIQTRCLLIDRIICSQSTVYYPQL